jgi:hypothetical protein
VERAGGDEVDGPAEQVGELVGELLDVPTQPSAGSKGVEDVEVAVGARGPAGLRAEQVEFGDPVPVADRGEACLVDLHTRDGRHQARVAAGARGARRHAPSEKITQAA